MKQSRATIRYAKALLQLSIEKNNLEETYSDMVLLDNLCSKSKEIILLLKSPIIKTDIKIKILDKIFENKVSSLSEKFIKIIVSKKREYLLAEIAKSFVSLYNKHNNIETVTITTAVPISEELKEKIISYIKDKNNNKVELKEVVSENIIGGAIITMGDKQLDASISTEIAELRQTFNKNLYLQDF